MQRIIRRQYAAPGEVFSYTGPVWSFESIPEDLPSSVRMIAGHIPFGIHEAVPGPTTYITLLREPTARVLSLYRYILENSRHPLHARVRGMSLEEFLLSDVDRYEVENGQTRQISGHGGEPDRMALEAAKRNLQECFSVIGLLERFDETVLLMRNRLGWRMPFYVRRNMTSKPHPRFEALAPVLEAMKERNQLDMDLYAFAGDLFEQAIEQQGHLFAAEVMTFLLLNRLAQGYARSRQILEPRRSTRRGRDSAD